MAFFSNWLLYESSLFHPLPWLGGGNMWEQTMPIYVLVLYVLSLGHLLSPATCRAKCWNSKEPEDTERFPLNFCLMIFLAITCMTCMQEILLQKMVKLDLPPNPEKVTNQDYHYIFLLGNPMKPLFATVTGWWVNPRYHNKRNHILRQD